MKNIGTFSSSNFFLSDSSWKSVGFHNSLITLSAATLFDLRGQTISLSHPDTIELDGMIGVESADLVLSWIHRHALVTFSSHPNLNKENLPTLKFIVVRGSVYKKPILPPVQYVPVTLYGEILQEFPKTEGCERLYARGRMI